MNSKLFEMQCPTCKSTWFIKTDTVFHDELHPQVKATFYDFSFFKRKCKTCGELIDFYVPLVYYFVKQKCLITYMCEATNNDECMVYKTSSIVEFVETIKIVESGYSYEKIMSIKQQLTAYDDARFDAIEGKYIFFTTKQGDIAIELK